MAETWQKGERVDFIFFLLKKVTMSLIEGGHTKHLVFSVEMLPENFTTH